MRPLTTFTLITLGAAAIFYAFKKLAFAETIPPQYSTPFNKNQTQKNRKTSPNESVNIADSTAETLRLMFVGDIMSQSQQIASAVQSGGSHNYTPCFRYIRPILEQADLAFGNLECTLRSEPPFTGYPNFRSPDQLGEALRWAGFDVLVTANNHALDGGLNGLTHTLDVLKKNRFLTTGTFRNERERAIFYPKIIYKKGFKIALLNATHHTNGYRTPTPSVVNRLDIAQLKADLKKAQAMTPDFIITFLHWGNEHKLDEDVNQRALARILHEAGSHLVIGAHPHVVQPIKNEPVKNNKKIF
ncbi:MAG: CapA family protein [Saprospiraceae bacterium]|nr:CapA family protein [Saprospiraceae bacterium]